MLDPSDRAICGRRLVEPWTDAYEDSTVPVSVKLTVTVEAIALLERAWVTS
jgi:hypothetical protein